MKPWKRNLFTLLAVLTVLSLLLSACGPVTSVAGNANNTKDKNKGNVSEKGNGNGNGNETEDQGGGANKITICHRTGSDKHPYVVLTVSGDALKDGHATHDSDIIPAPKDGCPSTAADTIKNNENETESDTDVSANKVTICHKTGSAKHPYVQISVSNDAARNGHAGHPGDIIPAPQEGCPSTAVATDVPAK